ncbi:hypothetical protein IFM89_008935 [Coptis chinensis]|uniref:T-complex protein 1 subunit beta n=1 Tax=Coptis chinensis TaxID=261450 RepID=A0A835I1K2_9MAGN|nr:hypothetical protein IFM89_008935 [Coptis chinensis]
MAQPLPFEGEEMVGSKQVIKKVEFVRIITKVLYSLGYEKSGALLEEEFGILLHSSVVSLFRQQDKILQSTGRGHNISVTNDGATILKSLHIDNPAVKVLVDISKVQDDEVGDGTTLVVVLAGELLREVEKLVAMKIHPMTIISS